MILFYFSTFSTPHKNISKKSTPIHSSSTNHSRSNTMYPRLKNKPTLGSFPSSKTSGPKSEPTSRQNTSNFAKSTMSQIMVVTGKKKYKFSFIIKCITSGKTIPAASTVRQIPSQPPMRDLFTKLQPCNNYIFKHLRETRLTISPLISSTVRRKRT